MRNFCDGVHSGHIQSTHYSSKSEDKRIYTFHIPIWRPSWISHFTQALPISHFTQALPIFYFGYHLICISASSVPMNYFYMLQLFFDPQTPRKEMSLPINIHTIKLQTFYLQILYTSMLWPLCNCITVYKYEFDKYMLVCANKRS